jgi:predicted methyltransferase
MPRFMLAALAALVLAAPAFAQAPPADALSDPSMKAKEVIAFMGLKPGDQVADVVAGRFMRALSQAVGPKGKVYAIEPDEVTKIHPEILASYKQITADAAYGNLVLLQGPVNSMAWPKNLDAVFIRQNYHDLYDKFMGPADVPAFNKAVYNALKPGGVYVILDHADAPGTDLKGTETVHRIDPERVKKDMAAAGFQFAGESKIFANPADARKMVFDPSIRGKTDQFLYKFRKPR